MIPSFGTPANYVPTDHPLQRRISTPGTSSWPLSATADNPSGNHRRRTYQNTVRTARRGSAAALIHDTVGNQCNRLPISFSIGPYRRSWAGRFSSVTVRPDRVFGRFSSRSSHPAVRRAPGGAVSVKVPLPHDGAVDDVPTGSRWTGRRSPTLLGGYARDPTTATRASPRSFQDDANDAGSPVDTPDIYATPRSADSTL